MIRPRAIVPLMLVALAAGAGALFAACGSDDPRADTGDAAATPGAPVKAIKVAGRAPKASNLEPASGIPELRSRRRRAARSSGDSEPASRPSTPAPERSTPAPAPQTAAPAPAPAPRPEPRPAPSPAPAPSGGGGSFDDSG